MQRACTGVGFSRPSLRTALTSRRSMPSAANVVGGGASAAALSDASAMERATRTVAVAKHVTCAVHV